MVFDPAIRDRYRGAMLRNSQMVTFTRVTGIAPNVTTVSATVPAVVYDYLVAAEVDAHAGRGTSDSSGITQGDRKAIVLAGDLADAGFPLPVKKNDQLLVGGETLNVTEVDPNKRHLAGAIELSVVGV